MRHAAAAKKSPRVAGTMFAAIRQIVLKIPRGKVATYGDVARDAGYPGAARQVVWALHSSRGLPWQRVVGAQGRILLSGEHGFEQRMRLAGEGVSFAGDRVRMELHQFRKKRKTKSRSDDV